MKLIDVRAPFLPSLSDFILKEHGNELPDLSDILMVFPTGRSGIYFRRILIQKCGRDALFPPAIKDINGFISSLYMECGEQTAVGRLEKLFLLKEAVSTIKHGSSGLFKGQEGALLKNFIDFAGYGAKLSRFFDELAGEGVSFDVLKSRGLYTDYDEHIKIFGEIYDIYISLLQKHGFTDTPGMLRFLTEDFSISRISQYKKIYFCGFFALTNIQSAFLKKIIDSGKGELILHTAPAEIKKARKDSVFIHHRRIVEKVYGENIDFNNSIIDAVPSERLINPRIKCLRNDIEQVSYILESISEACSAGIKPERIAVILPDEKLSSLLVEAFNNHGVKYNLTVGYPMRETAFYSFFSILLELFSGEFYYKDFLSFLSHPFIKGAVFNGIKGEAVVYPVMEALRRENYVYINTDSADFRDDCRKSASDRNLDSNALDGFFSFISEVKKGYYDVNGIESLTEYFSSLIKTIFSYYGTENRTNHPFFRESIEKAEKSIGELLSLSSYIEKFFSPDEKAGFVKLFLKELSEKHITVTAGSPFTGVQIMGVIEAMNLDFDALIIPSMNEGIFPAASSKDLFLNTAIRQEAGLPTYRDRESLYGLYFEGSVKSAKAVFISYLREEEESKNLPSRFIEKAGYKTGMLGMNEPDSQFNYYFVRSAVPRSSPPETEIRKTPEVIKAIIEGHMTQGALKDYIECPYRFYIRRVLKIKEREEISEEFENLKIGNIIHNALKEFVKEMYLPENSGLSEKELWKILEGNLDDAFRKERPSGFDEIMGFNALKSSLPLFLENEILRRNDGYKTERKYLEADGEFLFSIDGGLKIKLSGRIDRIDIHEDKFLIIDYKTGNIPSKDKIFKFVNDPVELQLPFYTLIFTSKNNIPLGRVESMAYYDLKDDFNLKERCSGDDIDEKMKGFEYYLRGKLREILDESVPFVHTGKPANCKYCPYPSVCRIEELRI